MVVFFPAVWITGLVVKLFSLMWRKPTDQTVTITEEELETILDTAEDAGVIDENETELLQSALDFTDMDAGDILTPRIDVVGFEIGDSMEEILKVINETQFSRYPVYERTVDHVVGILYVKHLLKELATNKTVNLQELLLEESLEYSGAANFEGTNELFDMWCAGDEATLREYLSDEVDTSELTEEELAEYEEAKPLIDEYNKAMSYDRNDGMLEVAIEYLESGDVVFYAVGLAHLLNDRNGLVDTLRAAGYTVELVTFQ